MGQGALEVEFCGSPQRFPRLEFQPLSVVQRLHARFQIWNLRSEVEDVFRLSL
jgi:hypothetical protein